MNARLNEALAHWAYVAPLLVAPTSAAEYEALVDTLDAILDAGGADESHPLAGLANMMGDLVGAYEAMHTPMPAAMTGAEALRFLMDQHGLRQADLPEIGNQAKVSELLAGKREINLRQARALAAHFGVGIETFA